MQIVAEIGLQHCGCLGTAFAFVDAIADAGVDVAKFQCHAGDKCSTYRPGMESYFHESRQEYWRRTAFTHSQWSKLADKCHKRGLQFSCSVFSLQGIEMMSTLVDIWKVPSSKTNDHELLRAVAATGKPVVLSTGMSDRDEIHDALDVLKEACLFENWPPVLLQCTSEYPTPAEHVGLFDFGGVHKPWGLSDHTGKVATGIAAAAVGAHMLEVHVAWHRAQWGPDVSSSLTIEELKQLVEGVRFVERMRASTVTKDDLYRELEPVRRVFRG